MSIDKYISSFPPDVQDRLKQLRTIIRKAAPKAEEIIKYGMPTYMLDGNLVYFAGYKKHIGFYPLPKSFHTEAGAMKFGAGSLRLPNDQKLPVTLIKRIIKFRIAENKRRLHSRQSKKGKK